MKDKKLDKHGILSNQDKRIPLPLARKLINTWCGFQFSDIQYKETGNSLNNLIDFTNLMTEANRSIDVTKETEYFKYFKAINQFNDNDVLDLVTAIECANHGRAYKIYYFDKNMLKCDTVPSCQIEPVYQDTLNPMMEKAIRYYHECKSDDKGQEIKIYFADVYTAAGIEYYKADKDDYSDAILNPDKTSIIYGTGNTIPEKMHVVEYNIFRDKAPLIAHAYGMIDEIDRVLSKNIAEELAGFKAAILRMSASVDDIHKDSQGLTAYDRLLKTNVIDNQFKEDIMEWVTKEIQDSFIFGAYDRLKKDIFELVDIPNFSDGESWGNTISGVSAGFRLLGFMFLCNQTFRIWQEGKRQEIDLINAYAEILSENAEVKRSMNELNIISNRILPKNILENAQIAGMLKGLIPNSDLIKMFPEITSDPDGAVKELEEQLEKENNMLMGGLNESPQITDESLTPLPENSTGQSFNGAQVQAINDIVSSVASGDISRDSGINQLIILFGITPEQAERIIGESGTKTGALKQGAVIKAVEGKPTVKTNAPI
jgi:SPP1 family phage portal protein